MTVANHPMKPDPTHAAYIGLVMALVAFGVALAALGLALAMVVH